MNRFSYSTDFPYNAFIDDLYFSQFCSKTLYTTSNHIGKTSLLNLIKDFSTFEIKWYQNVLSKMEDVLPNSAHTEVFKNSENEHLKSTLNDKISNSSKHVTNYSLILNKSGDEFNVFKFGLIGINKSCFSTDIQYQEIFDFGPMAKLYDMEEYSINRFGSQQNRILISKYQLERKLTNEDISDEGLNTSNLLSNKSTSIQNIKFKKTEKSISSLSDLHELTALSITNLYSIQTHSNKLFLALAILSGVGVFLIALAEYDYRITKKNICTKVCYIILLALVLLGVIISSVMILLSQVTLSQILRKIQDKSCIDANILVEIQKDLILEKLLIPMSIGLGLVIIVSILGLSLSCHFWTTRWKYRLWKPIGGRFM